MLKRGQVAVARVATLSSSPRMVVMATVNVAAFSFAVALPMSLYVLILLTAMVIYYTRPVTQKPLSLILERLEGAKSGVFTIFSSALALIVAILAALRTALS